MPREHGRPGERASNGRQQQPADAPGEQQKQQQQQQQQKQRQRQQRQQGQRPQEGTVAPRKRRVSGGGSVRAASRPAPSGGGGSGRRSRLAREVALVGVLRAARKPAQIRAAVARATEKDAVALNEHHVVAAVGVCVRYCEGAGEEVYSELIAAMDAETRRKCEHSTAVLQARLQALARAGRNSQAEFVLRALVLAGGRPDAATYRRMAATYARRAQAARGHALVREMRARGEEVELMLYASALQASWRELDSSRKERDKHAAGSDAARRFERRLNLTVRHARELFNSLRATGAIAGEGADPLPPSELEARSAVWLGMLRCYASARCMEDALVLIDELKQSSALREAAGARGYAAVMHEVARTGDTTSAEGLLKRMAVQPAVAPDVNVYNALLETYATALAMPPTSSGGGNFLPAALALTDRLEAEGVAPNARTRNLVLKCYTRAGDMASAESLVAALEEDGQADTYTYNTLLVGWSSQAASSEGAGRASAEVIVGRCEAVLQRRLERGIPLDSHCVTIVLDVHRRALLAAREHDARSADTIMLSDDALRRMMAFATDVIRALEAGELVVHGGGSGGGGSGSNSRSSEVTSDAGGAKERARSVVDTGGPRQPDTPSTKHGKSLMCVLILDILAELKTPPSWLMAMSLYGRFVRGGLLPGLGNDGRAAVRTSGRHAARRGKSSGRTGSAPRRHVRRATFLDLHSFARGASQVAVAYHLAELCADPDSRLAHGGRGLTIVTGRGLHSASNAATDTLSVVFTSAANLLNVMGVAYQVNGRGGRIELARRDLLQLAEHLRAHYSPAARAMLADSDSASSTRGEPSLPLQLMLQSVSAAALEALLAGPEDNVGAARASAPVAKEAVVAHSR